MISIRPHIHASGHHADHAARPTATPNSAAPPSNGDVERRPPRHAGLRIGVLLATVTWCWVAAIDAILGEPLRTASVLGGVATFTAAHLILCLAFGAALTGLMNGAMEDPGLVLSVVFGTLLLGVAFAMLTVLVSMTSLGNTAWLRIFIGNLIGTAVALVTLARWYPVRHLLARALHED